MRWQTLIGLLIGALFFTWWVWPTPWEYSRHEYTPRHSNGKVDYFSVRKNRFTGEVQSNIGDGWQDGIPIVD